MDVYVDFFAIEFGFVPVGFHFASVQVQVDFLGAHEPSHLVQERFEEAYAFLVEFGDVC